ncbi:MAG: DUF1460 domain-containing protein [Muribaculaceae bacterium]|nr:DUF1460 domain-containing protein [Muribaculaceae bacterium]MBQ7212662.1 DUF1460 domain-containing protein [Muribaculaceae bacterium]
MTIKRIVLALILLTTLGATNGATLEKLRFHNEETDTTRITSLLIECREANLPTPEARVAWLGKKFLGTPYVAHTLEGETEMITINLDELDCTTFVETVLALAYTVGEDRTSWRDFAHNLERMRYRGGHANGYASRLHYISDWIVDNSHRGNIEEASASIPGSDHIIKTIDFMTRHRDLYPALADSAEYERIKNVEIGYRSHRYPYVKWTKLNNKATLGALREGDAVALTTSTKDLDVSHLGILVKVDGKFHLMHASSVKKKVIIDPLPIYDYFKKSRSLTGLRIVRLAN